VNVNPPASIPVKSQKSIPAKSQKSIPEKIRANARVDTPDIVAPAFERIFFNTPHIDQAADYAVHCSDLTRPQRAFLQRPFAAARRDWRHSADELNL
jgi:hypothetical protein